MKLLENNMYRSALERVLATVDLSFLVGKTLLITGATGMLGSCLVDMLTLWDQKQKTSCKILALSRNAGAAQKRFAINGEMVCVQEQDVRHPLHGLPEQVDYMIHAASNADPAQFAQHPVETLLANVAGTQNLLDYGRSHGMKRFLYVSSGEVYGQPDENLSDFTESYCGPLDLFDPRSCYPEGKRAAEVLCQSYIRQHQIDAVIVRPCHLFGPTMTSQDSRAVSQFLRNAVCNQDIVLKSAGAVERSHCYSLDAAGALLLVLKNGGCGQAYNIADRRYQMTIRQFAEAVAQAGQCRVVFEQPKDSEVKGYSKTNRAVLAEAKIAQLGWSARCEGVSKIEESVAILRSCHADAKECACR